MEVMRLIGAIGILLEAEESRIDLRQKSTSHATEPAREGTHGYAYLAFRRKGVDVFLGNDRRHTQSLYLRTQDDAHRFEQPGFLDGLASPFLPTIEPHRDH
jgi:hypothetical protein